MHEMAGLLRPAGAWQMTEQRPPEAFEFKACGLLLARPSNQSILWKSCQLCCKSQEEICKQQSCLLTDVEVNSKSGSS